MSYQPGEILLDKYRIEALIGQGASGDVYRVTHLALKVPRAIKVLRKDTSGLGSSVFEDVKRRFMVEGELGAQLHRPEPNPHLLQIYDSIQRDDLLVLEMEYAAGGSLLERLKKQKDSRLPFPIDEALNITVDIAEGLGALHEMDLVHRDIKPANILFDTNGHARLADLGLAQVPGGPSLRSQLSSPLPHPGTPGYMSPEQSDSRQYLTSASDIYCLGLVLFEMLTGRVYNNQPANTRARSLRKDIPADLDKQLAQMLAKKPEDRPWNGKATAEQVRHIIQRLGGAGSTGMSTSRTSLPPRSVNLWPILGGFVILLSVVVAVLAGQWIFSQATRRAQAVVETLTAAPPIVPTMTAVPTSSPTITITPVPTNTPVPTDTPVPTNTPAPTATATLGVGSRLILNKGGLAETYVYVPAGVFWMGSEYPGEGPVRQVTLDAFWIDQTEVTNAMYARCVNDVSCKPVSSTAHYSDPQFANHPVAFVDWEKAAAYCAWAGGALPSEAQWEKAARGKDGRNYPWGEGIDASRANYDKSAGWFSDPPTTMAVGMFEKGASPYGALDMAGNVFEWVADWSAAYDPAALTNPKGPENGDKKVLRGGSYWKYLNRSLAPSDIMSYTSDWRATARFALATNIFTEDIGFRCVRPVAP